MTGGECIAVKISSFSAPTKVISGVDARKNLGKEVKALGGKIVLVCTDKGIVNAGLLVDVLDSLSRENLAYVIFDEVVSNPTIETLENGLAIYRNEQCDVLVAVGGGSAIDTAKAICGQVIATASYSSAESFCSTVPSVVAVPTAAGTGAEILSSAVITDKSRNCKIYINSPLQAPRVAILDPLLLQTLPASLAAATGMVTLTHAVEGYVSLGSSELTDLLNLKAIQLVAKYLRRFIANRKDLEAAIGMQNACLYSALGSSNAGLGNVYAMANALAGHMNIHHGIACAVTLPAVMEFNAMACPEKFIHIATCFGESVSSLPAPEASLKAVEAVKKLARDVGLPERLPESGLTGDLLEQMAREVIESEIPKTNPRETSMQDIIRLYRESVSLSQWAGADAGKRGRVQKLQGKG